MFQKHKRRETKSPLNNRGFSLIEILIAVGILALIIVPLAMNMITGAQLNSKSKQVAASSDLTTSIMEIMQTVDLSDILTDVNWQARDEYDVPKDEYGTDLEYTLTGTALKNYDIAAKMEVIKSADGRTYTPVIGQYDESGNLLPDYLVTASVNIRENVDGLKKAYFTGQESEEYAFLLKGVETDESYVDILVTVTPEQKFEIVNITSMAQSEVIYTKQANDMNQNVANEFKAANDVYVALKGDGSIPRVSADWFLNNMTRTIEINLVKDTFSEATTITMTAIYTAETDGLRASDKTITKKLGSFSTNSTFEYARGIYIYYTPLMDFNGTSTPRDHVVINNKNGLSAPVFLIAVANDAALDLTKVTDYHPTLTVNETSDQTYGEIARTTVCSNVDDAYWNKTLYPIDRVLDVKNIGNSSWQQTLYKSTIRVYTHRDDCFDAEGIFAPLDKYLLVETTGTFIDTSEILDIASDSQNSASGTPGLATADTRKDIVYDGEEHKGVYGNGVVWSGQTAGTNAGTYVAKATPINGYTWQDGSSGSKTFTWEIARSRVATASGINHVYCAQEVTGVRGQYIEFGGIYKTSKVGNYTAYVTPDINHAWEDGTYETKTIKWRISPKELVIEWGIGEGKDVWSYDGNVHYASCTVHGVFEGDECVVTLTNDSIKDVGSKTAKITNISNSNYRLPDDGLTHKITVTSAAAAYVEEQEEQYLVYDGKQKNAVRASSGVYFTGTYSATNAGTYTYTANVMEGYTWEGGGVEPRTYTWELFPREADLSWGENSWVYTGSAHSTTCVVSNIVYGDTVHVTLSGNSITNVGSTTVYATKLSNPNYVFAESKPGYKIQVTRAPIAYVITKDFEYSGATCVGVTGQNISYDGITKAVNVNQVGDTIKPYTCIVAPLSNYAWADGTYGQKTVSWTISPLKDVSYQWSDFTYSGLPTTGIFRVKNATVTGDIEKIAPGNYTAIITPNLNHAWPDGSVASRTRTWSIKESSFPMPTLNEANFIYDGNSHSPTFTDGSVSDGIVVSGDLSATAANLPGEYYCVIVSLRNDGSGATKWADGTTGPLYLYWHIEPKEVGIQWNENVWTYDAKTHYGTAKCTGLVGSDVCDFTYSNNSRKDAGSQKFQITGTTNTNYKIPTSGLENNMTINKKEVGINWGTTTWTYDTKSHTVDPTPTGICTGDSCDFDVTNATRTNAGQQTVTITSLNNNNYKLPSNLTTTLTINRSPTATASAANKTYNGSQQTGVTGSNVTWGGTTAATNAGKYTATATPTSNYAWSDGTYAAKSIEWTMDKAAGSVSKAPTGKRLHYTGSSQTLINAGSSSTGTMYYKLGSSGSWSTSLPSATNSGTYTIYYKSVGDANHYDTAEKSVTATITAIELDYCGKRSYCEYSGGTISYTNVFSWVSSDISLLTYVSGTKSATSCGRYKVTLQPPSGYVWSADAQSKYGVGATGSVTLEWAITEDNAAKVSVSNKSYTLIEFTKQKANNTSIRPGITYTHSEFVSGTVSVPANDVTNYYGYLDGDLTYYGFSLFAQPASNYCWTGQEYSDPESRASAANQILFDWCDANNVNYNGYRKGKMQFTWYIIIGG